MFSKLGVPELIIILVIIALLFGVGKISKIGGEIGGAIRAFRKGLKGEEKEKKDDSTQE
jgi:sec-independent protein translocase protein TatA